MSNESTETLEQRMDRLLKILEKTRSSGIMGKVLAERIEGDLARIIDSSWINCYEYLSSLDEEKLNTAESLQAAMDFALKTDMGMVFLKFWRDGRTEELHKLWPDAPESIYQSHSQPLP